MLAERDIQRREWDCAGCGDKTWTIKRDIPRVRKREVRKIGRSNRRERYRGMENRAGQICPKTGYTKGLRNCVGVD